VTECNAPLGLDTAARVGMLAHPWRAPALLARLARRWLTLARNARRMPAPDVVLVGYLGHFDVHLARLIFRRVPIVLDHLIGASDTARDRRLGGIARRSLLRTIDAAALRAADIVVVDTEEHLARLPERHRPGRWSYRSARHRPGTWRTGPLSGTTPASRCGWCSTVCTPPAGRSDHRRRAGQIAGAPIEVTMIGDGQDKAATMAAAAGHDAVRWLDWVPAADLPALVASHDVCLASSVPVRRRSAWCRTRCSRGPPRAARS